MERRVHRTCNLCEAMCGMIVTADGDQLRTLTPDPEDVLSRGHICPKGPAMRDLHEDPDRLRQPVRRTASGWEQVSWDAAIGETVDRIGEVQAKYGRHAVGVYFGN